MTGELDHPAQHFAAFSQSGVTACVQALKDCTGDFKLVDSLRIPPQALVEVGQHIFADTSTAKEQQDVPL